MATIKDLHIRHYEEQDVAWRGRYVHNWFSNFDKVGFPVTYRGNTTSVLEVAYVAAKNPDIMVDSPRGGMMKFIDRVFAARSPSEAKKLGNPKYRGGIIDPRPGWDNVSLAAMDYFLRQRWQPGTEDAKRLMAWPVPVVEANNWGDRRFGVTLEEWTGHNALGLLLTVIQEDLKSGAVPAGAEEADWPAHQNELVRRLNEMEHGQVVHLSAVPLTEKIPVSAQLRLF